MRFEIYLFTRTFPADIRAERSHKSANRAALRRNTADLRGTASAQAKLRAVLHNAPAENTARRIEFLFNES